MSTDTSLTSVLQAKNFPGSFGGPAVTTSIVAPVLGDKALISPLVAAEYPNTTIP